MDQTLTYFWEDFVTTSEKYYRPNEVEYLLGDPTKAKKGLGWNLKTSFKDLVQMMVDHDLNEAAKLPEKVKLYPQEKWQWGWNNSSEVWNGRVAMILFLEFLLEVVGGNGPLHMIGLL